MVKVIVGDLFASKAQTLVNTVNCVGVMGKGVALEFKNRFPEMFEDYVKRCKSKQVKLGQPYLFRGLTPPWILNFPTKDHWRSVSRLSDIVEGLKYLQENYRSWGITSLAVPPLGCGQGQLEWRVVGPTLYRHLGRLQIPVELYAPFGTPHEELQPVFLEQRDADDSWDCISDQPGRLNPAWVAIAEILDRIEREPYHWPVGRVTLQKIAYFATESGIPTGLQYRRGSFGPYSADVKGVLTQLANNSVIREERLGPMFAAKVGPTFADARRAYAEPIRQWHRIIDKVTDLFLRMRTGQAELAATVHFAAKELASKVSEKPGEKEVLAEVMDWKKRRRPPLVESEVVQAIRNLVKLGWVDVRLSDDVPVEDDPWAE